jgi:hypothetical protein
MGIKINLGSQGVGIAGCGFRPQISEEECFEERQRRGAQQMGDALVVSTPVGPGEGIIEGENLR